MDDEARGLLNAAADHLVAWVQQQQVEGLTIEKLELEGTNDIRGDPFSPLIYAEIPANGDGMEDQGTIMLYGHLDKQVSAATVALG